MSGDLQPAGVPQGDGTLVLPASAAGGPPRIPRAIYAFAGVLLWRLLILFHFWDSPFNGQLAGDMRFYHEWAQRFMEGRGTDGLAFYGLPGFSVLLAFWYQVFGVNPGIVIFAHAVLEALTGMWLFQGARLLLQQEGTRRAMPAWVPEAAGGMAAAAWAFLVPAQAMALLLMPTAWMVCGVWFVVWLILRENVRYHAMVWLGLGILTGLLATMVATVLVLVPWLLGAIWVRAWKRGGRHWKRSGLMRTGAILLGVLAGTAPVWSYNCFVARDPVFLTAHSGLNFWVGNHPAADGYTSVPPPLRTTQKEMLADSITLAEKAAGRQLPRSEVSRYWASKGQAFLRENPGAAVRLYLRKVAAFWNAFSFDDLSAIDLLRDEGIVPPGLGFGVLVALGLAGALLGWELPAVRWISALIVLYCLALLPVFITERYRLPAAGGLIMLSCYTLWRIGWCVWRGSWRGFGQLAGALAGGFAVAYVPQPAKGLESRSPYNLAVAQVRAAGRLRALAEAGVARDEDVAARGGLLQRAEQNLKAAEAAKADPALLDHVKGLYWAERGDKFRSRQAYLKSLEGNVAASDGAINLAIGALEEKRWQLALEFLRYAEQRAPEDPSVYYLQARALQGAGKIAEALERVQKALALSPNAADFLQLKQALEASSRK